MRWALWCCALWVACRAEERAQQPEPTAIVPLDGGTASPLSVDSDHDGLCDVTERFFGTDPGRQDTDGDALPDLIELATGFLPTEHGSPAVDQVATLPAQDGAALEFALRVTVEGDGRAISGVFQADPSIYLEGTTAGAFLQSAEAVSAEPADAVRGINRESARFSEVMGKTRLEFLLRFQYSGVEEPLCTLTYPFRYGVKADDGVPLSERTYLLLLVPATADEEAAAHCLPGDCQ